jgi:hypothetical protein
VRDFHDTITVHQCQTVAHIQRGDSVLAYSLRRDTTLRAVRRKEACVAQLQSYPERTVSTLLQIADAAHAARQID